MIALTLLAFLAIIALAFGAWTLLSPPPQEQRGRANPTPTPGPTHARVRTTSAASNSRTPPAAPSRRTTSGASDPFEEFLRHSKQTKR